MTNLQAELFPGEAEMMWEEFCYHNAMCDTVSMMLRHGREKVISDIISMYESMEASND
jgi:hypothetical protein